EGRFTFSTEQPVTGLARKLQDSIKHFTGKKLAIKVGTESVDEEEGAPASGASAGAEPGRSVEKEPLLNATRPFEISGSVGRGGKNKPEDEQAVQAALNIRAKAGLTVDGKCGPKTIGAIMAFEKRLGQSKPDGLVEVGRGTG